MKPEEHDALLARLDERSRNTWRSVEKIEKHIEAINGQVKTNTVFRKVVTWLSCSIVLALIGIVAKLIAG